MNKTEVCLAIQVTQVLLRAQWLVNGGVGARSAISHHNRLRSAALLESYFPSELACNVERVSPKPEHFIRCKSKTQMCCWLARAAAQMQCYPPCCNRRTRKTRRTEQSGTFRRRRRTSSEIHHPSPILHCCVPYHRSQNKQGFN